MEKKAKNVPFFYKEQKRTQKTCCSFIKNARTLRSFEKKGCPTLEESFTGQGGGAVDYRGKGRGGGRMRS